MALRRKNNDETEAVDAPSKKGRRPFYLGLAAGALLSVAIGVFIFQNNESTDLEYLGADFSIPLWVGLLAAFAAGCIVGPLFGWSWRRHRRGKKSA